MQQVQRYNKAVAGEDVPDEEEVLAGGKDAVVKAAAKGKLLSHVVKRNVMQVVLYCVHGLLQILFLTCVRT